MNLLKKIFQSVTPLKRTIFFVAADGIIFIVSIYLSYALKFGLKTEINPFPYLFVLNAILLFLIVKFFVFFRLHLYQFTWQYVGLNELYNLLKANTFSMAIIFLVYFIAYSSVPSWLPKSVIISDYFISFILAGSLRISKRLFIEIFKPARTRRGKTTIIIGANSTGEMIMRDLRRENFENYLPVAFLDEDRRKWNTYIHDIAVLGDVSVLETVARKMEVTALLIADHSLNLREIKNIYTTAHKLGIKEIKIVPKLYSITNAEVTVKKLEDIHVEELINRQEIQVEAEKIGQFLKQKTILITGAAGSIGSEIVRQVILFNPDRVIIFEIDETEIFNLEKQLNERFPELADRVIYLVGDVKDKNKVFAVFAQYRPEIVFSTAAYKHVPLMESNPDEAIKVNLFGTYHLCTAADKFGVQKFINISTDKAVNPRSVMGMTKRIGEYIAQAFNETSQTRYISVRFGNVFGSRGSVIPVFLEQIRKGGPVTVTHPDMQRYFMTIPEAVTLVLQASVLGQGGEVMILDMGEPIRITRMAEELIKLHGLTPGQDIEITYTGIRPGEKIFEEILTAEEGTTKTTHERIYVAIVSNRYNRQGIDKLMDNFTLALKDGLPLEQLKQKIAEAVR
jgi:FlaA1/EpsC-like NDP-sugar epimerase